MVKKRKVVKKTPTKRAAAPPRARRPKPKKTTSGSLPARGPRQVTFEEAKDAAIDRLIQAIEEAERQLAAAKRSRSFDELAQVNGLEPLQGSA